jgi:hypothetical protein
MPIGGASLEMTKGGGPEGRSNMPVAGVYAPGRFISQRASAGSPGVIDPRYRRLTSAGGWRPSGRTRPEGPTEISWWRKPPDLIQEGFAPKGRGALIWQIRWLTGYVHRPSGPSTG